MGVLGRMMCRAGLHRWESEPSDLDALRLTGEHHGFSSVAIQKGSCHCRRRFCKAEKLKFRMAVVGFGGPLSPSGKSRWRRLSKRLAERISNLPPLTV